MTEIQISKHKFDLEERTHKFACEIRDFVKKLPRTISNIEYSKQIIRSSSSLWLNLLESDKDNLIEECNQLVKIFTAIISKSS